MATWVTHLMIADNVLNRLPQLHRRGFCAGNIAPDCNVENEDWTAFTPSRQVTHWMQGERKAASDCFAFCKAYILDRRDTICSSEEYAFLLGYYAHLITDAAFQAFIREEARVKAAWCRIRADAVLGPQGAGMEPTWDSIKKLIPKKERMQDIYTLEAEYLQAHPGSGYLTDILPLTDFPDYVDYLPTGAIVRKIRVMGYRPTLCPEAAFLGISREEYAAFVTDATTKVLTQFCQAGLFTHI